MDTKFTDMMAQKRDTCTFDCLPQVLNFSGGWSRECEFWTWDWRNEFICGEFLGSVCKVVGIDLSRQRIEIARRTYPDGRFEVMPADDQLLSNAAEEPFDFVVSTEVMEQLYAPREFPRGCFNA
jgi:hypothetical protein